MNKQLLHEKFNNLGHRELHTALETACINGSLSEIRYLLTSSQIRFNIDINIHSDNPLFLACQSGNLHVVKYLLTSPELTKHADIYSRKNRCFRAVCNSQHMDVAEYLICEFQIEKNENIENYLKSKKTVFCSYVKNMFDMRSLKSTLENELNSDKINEYHNSKIKI